MAALLIRHRVADLPVWNQVFEDDRTSRRAYGAQEESVFHNPVDPTELVILMEWDDPDRARLFAQSDDLQATFARAGVRDGPSVWVLEYPGGTCRIV
jgi:hypothetical protein